MTMTIQEIKKAYTPDQAAQEAVWLHGCSIQKISDIADKVNNKVHLELCVNKIDDPKLFNNFGIALKGKVTLMSKTDLSSYQKDESSERTFDKISDEEYLNKVLVKNYNDLKPIGDDFNYTESFLIPTEVVGVWVMDYMLKRRIDAKRIQKLKDLGFEIIVVESK